MPQTVLLAGVADVAITKLDELHLPLCACSIITSSQIKVVEYSIAESPHSSAI